MPRAVTRLEIHQCAYFHHLCNLRRSLHNVPIFDIVTQMLRILVSMGTRPEIIKLAPVLTALKAEPELFEVSVLFSGQHRELSDQMAACFEISPRWDLRVMHNAQPLADLTGRLVSGISKVLNEYEPDLVLAQGDTSTVLATALASYYQRTPFVHVEAGLRTQNLYSPFPEEGNRRLISQLTQLHLAPTEAELHALIREGFEESRIVVTGNTVVDALHKVLGQEAKLPFSIEPSQKMVLLTLHRRENHGTVLTGILEAIVQLLERRPDITVVYPVHPNPAVQQVAKTALGSVDRALLIEPLDYPSFVKAMSQSTLLLSDSGGIQEEAPSLGIPLLVLRESSARGARSIESNTHIVGTHPNDILEAALAMLDRAPVTAVGKLTNPYGDGCASARIVTAIKNRFLNSPS